MAEKFLVLMCGPSGAGKTTWVQGILEDANEYPVYYVSRDEVRFSMLSDEDSYFAKEDAVFAEWIRHIQEHLDSEEDCYVIADATHLNERSRNRTLDHLNMKGVKIIPVVINPGLKECLKRNEQRTGRAKVPPAAIQRMFNSFNPPTDFEKYKYHHIIVVL